MLTILAVVLVLSLAAKALDEGWFVDFVAIGGWLSLVGLSFYAVCAIFLTALGFHPLPIWVMELWYLAKHCIIEPFGNLFPKGPLIPEALAVHILVGCLVAAGVGGFLVVAHWLIFRGGFKAIWGEDYAGGDPW